MDESRRKQYEAWLMKQVTNDNIEKTNKADENPFSSHTKNDYKEESSLDIKGDSRTENPNLEKTDKANQMTYEELMESRKTDYKEKSSLEIEGEKNLQNPNLALTRTANINFNNKLQGYPKFLSFGGKLAPLFYGNGISSDSEIDISKFVHEAISQESDWIVFQDLLKGIFDDVKTVADSLITLPDVNNLDENLLPRLSNILKYTYRYDLPHGTNRDIIKRWLWLLNQKGRDQDILTAADFANNPNWIKSTMLVPTSEYPSIEIDRTSRVYYPVDLLFTHDVSAFSDTHRYSDSRRWRDGVVVIEVNELTDLTREAVRNTLPAGLKAFFDRSNEMKGDGTGHSVPFKGWWFLLDYVLDIFLTLDDGLEHGHDGDSRDINFIYSGGQYLWPHYELQTTLGASTLPLYGKFPSENAANLIWMLDLFKKSLPNDAIFTDPRTAKAIEIASKYIDNSTDPLIQNKLIFAESIEIPTKPEITLPGYGDGNYDDDLVLGGKEKDNWDTEPGKETEYYSGEYASEFSINKLNLGETKEFTSLTDSNLKREFLKNSIDTFLDSFSPWTSNNIHKINYEISGIDSTVQSHRLPHYDDEDSTYSGKYAMSGLSNEMYVEARHHEIHPNDNTYPVSLVGNKFPARFNYQDCSLDAIADYEEFLTIDPVIYKEYMAYRGPISYIFKGETDKIDYISPGNPNKTFKENTLSDWIISEGNEVYRIHEMTLKDIYRDLDSNLISFSEMKLSHEGGKSEFITFQKKDHYRDDYAMPVNIDYMTSYGKTPISECLLRERLVTDSWIHSDYDFLCHLSLNSEHFGENLSELRLSDEVESYNYVKRKLISEVSFDDVINPSRYHKNTTAKDSLLFDYRRPFSEKILNQGVKVLEEVPV